MGEFIRRFTQLNGRIATIILEHGLFGKQHFEVEEIEVFEDKERLGVVLHGQDVFVFKPQLKSMELRDGFAEFADKQLKISIKVCKNS